MHLKFPSEPPLTIQESQSDALSCLPLAAGHTVDPGEEEQLLMMFNVQQFNGHLGKWGCAHAAHSQLSSSSSPSWAAGGELSPGEDGLAQEKLGPETGTGGCVSPLLLLQASEGLSGWMSLVASVGGKWDSCLLRKT